MKKVLLALTVLVALAQAGNIVHYDVNGDKDDGISKPNHPSTEIYK
jgi:hypothetical protein